MLTVKAGIPPGADHSPVLPVVIPDVSEAKAFANHLHMDGKHWRGSLHGNMVNTWEPETSAKSPENTSRQKRIDEIESAVSRNSAHSYQDGRYM